MGIQWPYLFSGDVGQKAVKPLKISTLLEVLVPKVLNVSIKLQLTRLRLPPVSLPYLLTSRLIIAVGIGSACRLALRPRRFASFHTFKWIQIQLKKQFNFFLRWRPFNTKEKNEKTKHLFIHMATDHLRWHNTLYTYPHLFAPLVSISPLFIE